MRRIILHRPRLTALVLSALLTVSCGGRGERLPETGATLEGKVTYDGEPLEFALIVIQTDNGSATGRIGDDMRYRVENVPLGVVRVGVNTSAARGDYQSKVMSESNGTGRVSHRFIEIPGKYFDPEQSGFTTTIRKGPNTYDIVVPK
jgi:hypothetical protein